VPFVAAGQRAIPTNASKIMAKRVAAGVAAAGALGYGGYFAVQQAECSKQEQEVREWAKLVEAERKAIATSSKQITEQEERIKQLAEVRRPMRA